MTTTWRPLGAEPCYGRRRPQVGDVIGWEYRAWAVEHVRDAVPTADEEETLAAYGEKWRAEKAPYSVTLRRLHGEPHEWEKRPEVLALRCGTGAYGFPVYPHGRVPLCSCHQHPWPCAENLQQQEAEEAAARLEKELQRMPGTCPGCGEVVTHRQQSITFAGPNVRNPLDSDVTYHLRRKCWSAAAAYEEMWAKADPRNARSLLTLRCEGSLIVHGDGSAECFGASDSDCPSVYASHRSYSACYLQSHGCGRGCGVHQRGCHPAGRPADPRDLQGRDA